MISVQHAERAAEVVALQRQIEGLETQLGERDGRIVELQGKIDELYRELRGTISLDKYLELYEEVARLRAESKRE